MIVWSGFGFLVAVFGFASCLGMEVGVETWLQNDQYYQSHGWPKLLALSIAAAIVWPLGRILNCKTPARSVIDPETGETFVLTTTTRHTFSFIPMEYWAPILVVVGAIMAMI